MGLILAIMDSNEQIFGKKIINNLNKSKIAKISPLEMTVYSKKKRKNISYKRSFNFKTK